MKKILLVSLVMLLAVSVAFSQFGIKGGVNLGTFGGADSKQTIEINPSVPPIEMTPKSKTGLAAGISYKINLILGLSIQPEVIYVQKGAIYETGSVDISLFGAPAGSVGSLKMTTTLDYIDIPVLVKFSLPVPVLSPYIEGGVSYGILLSAKEKSDTSATITGQGNYNGSGEKDIKSDLPKNDLSILVGVGFELFILDINARYVMGITKLAKDFNGNDLKVYNRGIMLTAGLRF